jgi:hypothetical protein
MVWPKVLPVIDEKGNTSTKSGKQGTYHLLLHIQRWQLGSRRLEKEKKAEKMSGKDGKQKQQQQKKKCFAYLPKSLLGRKGFRTQHRL